MTMIAISFIAGLLTLAAPCVLVLLPVIVGGSVVQANQNVGGWLRWRRPVVIAASLAASVTLFSVLLKGTTVLLGVPQTVWQFISGGLLIALGLHQLFPEIWQRIMASSGLATATAQSLTTQGQRQSMAAEILTGIALGPVFTSCSPTYLLIVAVFLPASFLEGLGYIALYALGLATGLLAVAVLGFSLVSRLGWLRDPKGWFVRGVGMLFILVGLAVVLGWDKQFQAYILDQEWYQRILEYEISLQ